MGALGPLGFFGTIYFLAIGSAFWISDTVKKPFHWAGRKLRGEPDFEDDEESEEEAPKEPISYTRDPVTGREKGEK